MGEGGGGLRLKAWAWAWECCTCNEAWCRRKSLACVLLCCVVSHLARVSWCILSVSALMLSEACPAPNPSLFGGKRKLPHGSRCISPLNVRHMLACLFVRARSWLRIEV